VAPSGASSTPLTTTEPLTVEQPARETGARTGTTPSRAVAGDPVAFGRELAALANARDADGIVRLTRATGVRCPQTPANTLNACAGRDAGALVLGYDIELAGAGRLIATASQYTAFLGNALEAFSSREIVLKTVSEAGDLIVLGAAEPGEREPVLIFAVDWSQGSPLVSRVTFAEVSQAAGNLALLHGGTLDGVTYKPVLPPVAGAGMLGFSSGVSGMTLAGLGGIALAGLMLAFTRGSTHVRRLVARVR
jgi:hypothetical protein